MEVNDLEKEVQTNEENYSIGECLKSFVRDVIKVSRDYFLIRDREIRGRYD
tara:strand:- start:1018 stop:1170 length:153 start_codon:yes stop_codon:yes gene_type:complete